MKLLQTLLLFGIFLVISCSVSPSEENRSGEYGLEGITIDKSTVEDGESFTVSVYYHGTSSYVGIGLLSPSEQIHKEGAKLWSLDSSDLLSSSGGCHKFRFTPSKYYERGSWIVSSIYIDYGPVGSLNYFYDFDYNDGFYSMRNTGNYDEKNETEIVPAYINFSTSDPDTGFPKIRSYNLDKNNVSVGEEFTFTVEAYDIGPSGIDSLYAYFQNDYSQLHLQFLEDSPGVYKATSSFNEDDLVGDYVLTYITVIDNVNNQTNYFYYGIGDFMNRRHSDNSSGEVQTNLKTVTITYN